MWTSRTSTRARALFWADRPTPTAWGVQYHRSRVEPIQTAARSSHPPRPRGAIWPTHRGATVVGADAIYDNADWGIHLFPDAQGTDVAFNVLDGNGDGVIFARVRGGWPPAGTTSPTMWSRTRRTTEEAPPTPETTTAFSSLPSGAARVGRNNVLASNCFWQGASAGGGEPLGRRVRLLRQPFR